MHHDPQSKELLAQRLLEVARGERHWSSLTQLGVNVQRDINGWTFANTSTAIVPSKQTWLAWRIWPKMKILMPSRSGLPSFYVPRH